ncbi:hypothetical protein GCM10009020_34280 [Natronoarchaeum mannanilyticum]|uniref:Uncharacterized protein n=1 Tax=Natronoarchaeum mannanilyticum TaxID=926360 RepID=A0AAV3TE29_9EURY
MAARVHVSLVLGAESRGARLVILVGRLGDRERVDIDAEPHRRTITALDDRDNPGVSARDLFEDVGSVRPSCRSFVPLGELFFVRNPQSFVGIERFGADVDLIDTQAFEFVDDSGRGPELAPAGFREFVEFAPEIDEFLFRREVHCRCHR